MGHQDRGHYAKKHPNQTQDPEIADKINASARDGMIDCPTAHRIAKTIGCQPSEIGVHADLLELRIARCQMGLFGYGPGKKNFNLNVQISPALEKDILNTQEEGRISCRRSWDMAKAHKISRIDMGSACEKLEIRIKPCQLGAF